MNTVQRIEFIKRAQTLGFSLEEIGEILTVYDQGDCTCGQVRNSVESKVGVIERKLRELKALRRDLHAVMARLADRDRERSTTICPVIHETRPHR